MPEHGYGRWRGAATIDLREREEGARLKMWSRHKSLKVYDKAGQALRVETTINQPKDFLVRRQPEDAAADAEKAWQQMRKGVADLSARGEVSKRCNGRWLESLAPVQETTPLRELLEPLSRPVLQGAVRVARALNVWLAGDGKLLRVLAQGDFLLRGFRNRDVREALYGGGASASEQRRQSAAVTRQLAWLRAHGLIVKVQKTHRYQLSAEGRRVTAALLTAGAVDESRLLGAA